VLLLLLRAQLLLHRLLLQLTWLPLAGWMQLLLLLLLLLLCWHVRLLLLQPPTAMLCINYGSSSQLLPTVSPSCLAIGPMAHAPHLLNIPITAAYRIMAGFRSCACLHLCSC
jgi:hypothetical protein